jgi:hypothetical protein
MQQSKFFISKFYRKPFDEYNSKEILPMTKMTLYPIVTSDSAIVKMLEL